MLREVEVLEHENSMVNADSGDEMGQVVTERVEAVEEKQLAKLQYDGAFEKWNSVQGE